MTTTLKQGQNGPVLELDARLLSDAGIDIDTPLRVRVADGRIVAVREERADAPGDRERRFREAMEFTFDEYDDTLRRLAQ